MPLKQCDSSQTAGLSTRQSWHTESSMECLLIPRGGGGEGNNYANDLKQEHIVKGHKVMLHHLRGNKTLKAVTRLTSTSYSQQVIADRIDKESHISKESTAHTWGLQRRCKRCSRFSMETETILIYT